ncbi:MAG TPA: hypothetical protein VEI97_03405, partial [bacterium]|nr:hypothetical protein [bacterium]
IVFNKVEPPAAKDPLANYNDDDLTIQGEAPPPPPMRGANKEETFALWEGVVMGNSTAQTQTGDLMVTITNTSPNLRYLRITEVYSGEAVVVTTGGTGAERIRCNVCKSIQESQKDFVSHYVAFHMAQLGWLQQRTTSNEDRPPGRAITMEEGLV